MFFKKLIYLSSTTVTGLQRLLKRNAKVMLSTASFYVQDVLLL